jgi:phosphoadenosine phosphosulfate reductase
MRGFALEGWVAREVVILSEHEGYGVQGVFLDKPCLDPTILLQGNRPSMLETEPMLDLESVNPVVETYEPERIVRWAADSFGTDLVMSSSFGAESAALIHLATRVVPDIRIIMVDTGYLFPETFELMEDLRKRFSLNIWTYRTRNDPIRYLAEAGETDPTDRKNISACCAANKNEPFERAFKELAPKAWLRGIRRKQASTRADRKMVEWSGRYECYAISPLLNWTTRQMHAYMVENELPFHPLYEKGYSSIGCNPLSCTRPITIGEDSRAGRWAGTGKVECGLHLEGDGSGI